MKAQLISLDYYVPQCDTSLNTFPLVIGYAPDAAIRLEDPSIADHHCQITSTANGLIVSDLGSVHGTFVNGSRIMKSRLRHGDELAVGRMTFLVQFDYDPEARPTTPSKATRRANRHHGSPVGTTA